MRGPVGAAVAGGAFTQDLSKVATLLGQIHLGQKSSGQAHLGQVHLGQEACGQPFKKEVVAAEVCSGRLSLHPESSTSKNVFAHFFPFLTPPKMVSQRME